MKAIIVILSFLGVLIGFNDIVQLLEYQRLLIASGKEAHGVQYYTQITGDFTAIFILLFFCYLLLKNKAN